MRPFLPPLLAGALAHGDVGLDFDGTDYAFLEAPGFLAAVLALAVVSYAAARSSRAPDAVAAGLAVIAIVLGALLFAGSLAGEGHTGWPGLIAGAACAALGYGAGVAVLGRARRRLDDSSATLLPVYADGAALALAAASVLLPPLGLVGLGFLVVLVARTQRQRPRKYEGLRILR